MHDTDSYRCASPQARRRSSIMRVKAAFQTIHEMSRRATLDDCSDASSSAHSLLSPSTASPSSTRSSTEGDALWVTEEDRLLETRKANTRRVSLLLKEMVLSTQETTEAATEDETERFVQEESVNLCALRDDPLWCL
eukprot:Rhum_TRINITY_DN10280_c1_g1::Rhum_TRINITY_DN10280_c1_g1_i1::g.37751::m.37751